jgi:hypothetical protein
MSLRGSCRYCGGQKCSTRLSNQTELRTQTRSRKIATARHCRRGPRAYPAISDGWPLLPRAAAFHPRNYLQITRQINHAKNPHHARVTAAKTRKVTEANKRASFGCLSAHCNGGRSSPIATSSKIILLRAVAATLAPPPDEPSDHERGPRERDDHAHADEHKARTIAVPSSMVMRRGRSASVLGTVSRADRLAGSMH